MGLRNQEMRRLRAELANKDAIIAGFEADRVTYQGNNTEKIFHFLFPAYMSANNVFVADAINKAKEFADNVGTIDQLRNENTELKKLSESMKTELELAQKALAQAEQNLETERQQSKDSLRDVQDRLDKRLDESLAIDKIGRASCRERV